MGKIESAPAQDTELEQSIALEEEKPEFELVVIHPFGEYTRGQHIKNAAEIKAVLDSENRHHCHKIQPK